jgi:peroxiredoxin
MKKKNLLGFIFLIVSAIAFFGCSEEKAEYDRAVIKGHFKDYGDWVFLSKVSANNVKIIDSADLSLGQDFTFRLKADDYTVFRIATKDMYPLMVILKNGDTANIVQVDDKAWPFRVSGPEECMLLVDYLERVNRDHARVDSLALIFQESQSHPDFLLIRDQLNDEFIQIHENHKEYARNYITKHPSSIASIIVINGFFKEFALFSPRDDFKYYEIVDNALNVRMPDNKHVIDFHLQVENIRISSEYEREAEIRLSKGRMVPEFRLPSTSGNEVGPQDLIGKNILIYFWAAADAKSRQTNPIIKEAYNRYHKDGLEVLAISFDKDPNVWDAAIKLDALPGIHVSDLKGAGSPVQKLFNIKMRLPTYYLIDANGKIFDHDMNFDNLKGSIYDLYKSPIKY